MPPQQPSQAIAFMGEQDAGVLDTGHLLEDCPVIERAGSGWTAVCASHRRASLTVSDPIDLRTWRCAVCEAERLDRLAALRFVAWRTRQRFGLGR